MNLSDLKKLFKFLCLLTALLFVIACFDGRLDQMFLAAAVFLASLGGAVYTSIHTADKKVS